MEGVFVGKDGWIIDSPQQITSFYTKWICPSSFFSLERPYFTDKERPRKKLKRSNSVANEPLVTLLNSSYDSLGSLFNQIIRSSGVKVSDSFHVDIDLIHWGNICRQFSKDPAEDFGPVGLADVVADSDISRLFDHVILNQDETVIDVFGGQYIIPASSKFLMISHIYNHSYSPNQKMGIT
eukprot:TRINITY_DN6647_c0_g1_i3.p1 TRINITY_DN6647_c0_g1~~TRINITY_DN6647_c0_g1_i3.p1  ORF type:complete len:181 (-),score=36.59 TRINITY_DN6647_c0_g1_i3:636-1178(-)